MALSCLFLFIAQRSVSHTQNGMLTFVGADGSNSFFALVARNLNASRHLSLSKYRRTLSEACVELLLLQDMMQGIRPRFIHLTACHARSTMNYSATTEKLIGNLYTA